MIRRRRSPLFVFLACLLTTPARAQLLSDPETLQHTLDSQARWTAGLAAARTDAALRFLSLAEEILSLPRGAGLERHRLLAEAQGASELVASTDQELAQATTMMQETRESLVLALESRIASLLQNAGAATLPEREILASEARELERQVRSLRDRKKSGYDVDPLGSAVGTLSALAGVVGREHEILTARQMLLEELRLFLASLRLFDETSLPPSARSGEGGSSDPGCPPTACPIGGGSPADVPLAHAQPEGPGAAGGGSGLTPASLARLYGQIAAHLTDRRVEVPPLAAGDLMVDREIVLAGGILGFRDDGSDRGALAPRVTTSMVFSWPLDDDVSLTLEPSAGGRALRYGSDLFAELATEAREVLTGRFHGGQSQWQVTARQKGRFLSEPLAPPGYLEPGRVEAGLAGRLALHLSPGWELETGGGGDWVRYEPEDWQVLDREGIRGFAGMAWRRSAGSVRVSVHGSHHAFPHTPENLAERRVDDRLGVDVGGTLEGRVLARLSIGGSWNESRLPAYDFRSGRAALALSAPWRGGSLQGYAAVALQDYLKPGPEEARVSPSDQDSGALLSLQYARPLDAGHILMVRGAWSRSQTGFRDDFYERAGISLHLTFRSQ